MDSARDDLFPSSLEILFQNISYINLHNVHILKAIAEAFLCEATKQRNILIYLHKSQSAISKTFISSLSENRIVDLLLDDYYIVGWDLENPSDVGFFQCLNELPYVRKVKEMVENRIPCVMIIVPSGIDKDVLMCLEGSDTDSIYSTLQIATRTLHKTRNEKIQDQINEEETEMTSEKLQMRFANLLGDRDYDCFDFDQHIQLKEKIGFSLFGPPDSERYNEKQNKQIESLYNIILEVSSKFAEFKGRVIISFVYNCIEPLIEEKTKRAEKYKDYNPRTDLCPVPVFILRKCFDCVNPCRIVIDHTARVYGSWELYLEENKLDECIMVVPQSGRYIVNRSGELQLSRIFSPACEITNKVLRVADGVSTAGALVSGGIFVAAAIPAITVAPIALVAGGVVGASVGVYSIGRSIFSLIDRNTHHEPMSFDNSEARGAYLNILAGTLGFAGAGANIALSQMASRGINIGVGARAAVNTVQVMNLGASGASLTNSSYEVIDQWINENQAPSALTVLQLGSSFLFYGNAVANFKSAATIIEETQVNVIKQFQESLRSNRHRKMFHKIMKSTLNQNDCIVKGRSEVIAFIRNIPDKNEVMAALTRANKSFNQHKVKVTVEGGVVKLDGVALNYVEFMSMNKSETQAYLSSLSNNKGTNSQQVKLVMNQVSSLQSFKLSLSDMEILSTCVGQVFNFCAPAIFECLVKIVHLLIQDVKEEMLIELKKYLPSGMYVEVCKFIQNFFSQQVDTFIDKNSSYKFDRVELFEMFVKEAFQNGQIRRETLEKISSSFSQWLAMLIYNKSKELMRQERVKNHTTYTPQKVDCNKCGGKVFMVMENS